MLCGYQPGGGSGGQLTPEAAEEQAAKAEAAEERRSAMLAQVMCCSLAWASTCIACGGAVVQCWVHCNLQWIYLCPFNCQNPKSVAQLRSGGALCWRR